MSGGSYDYAYWKVEEMAHSMLQKRRLTRRREAFSKLLKLVATAMHDIEWVDSGDYGQDGDEESIDAVFAFLEADPETIAKARAFDDLKERMKEYFK